MKNNLSVQTNFTDHPAYKYWVKLTSTSKTPHAIIALKYHQNHNKKSAVFRMEGLGAKGAAIVAKRCKQATGPLEDRIYQEIIPNLPVASLSYYGMICEQNSNFCWLFLEDAAGFEFEAKNPFHCMAAVEWLGRVHSSAQSYGNAMWLPKVGLERYLELLHSGYNYIVRYFNNSVLTPEDRAVLNSLLTILNIVEKEWSKLQNIFYITPKTLVHEDFVPKNLKVLYKGEKPYIIALDWELAGWGVPAVDLALLQSFRELHNNDTFISIYLNGIQQYWPHVDKMMLERLIHLGVALRSIASIGWDATNLKHQWVDRTMQHMRIYSERLAESLQIILPENLT